MNMSKSIVVVGSLNIDLVAGALRIPVPGETILGSSFDIFSGGKGGNQAVAAARLGATVAMIGAVGKDTFGETLRGELSSAGVDISAVETVEGPSGTALISRGSKGENSIIVVPGANGRVTPQLAETNRKRIADASIVLVQLETPVDTIVAVSDICATNNVPLILDPAPAQVLPDGLLQRTTWLTPNETEQGVLLGGTSDSVTEAAARLLDLGPRNVVLKLGSKGAYLAGRDVVPQQISGFAVQAVDTTAAGDVFNAAFAVALSEGQDPASAARFASAAAAISVTRRGAQLSVPNRDEVLQLLGSIH